MLVMFAERSYNMIKDIQRDAFNGIGKPEPLKNNLSGLWSRRIDDANRIVYYEKEGSCVGMVEPYETKSYRLIYY